MKLKGSVLKLAQDKSDKESPMYMYLYGYITGTVPVAGGTAPR